MDLNKVNIEKLLKTNGTQILNGPIFVAMVVGMILHLHIGKNLLDYTQEPSALKHQ